MTAATKDILTDQYGTPDVVLPQLLNFPVAAATTLYAGTFAATNSSGYLVATPTASSKIWGRIEKQVVNTTAAGFGSAGDLNAEIHQGYFYLNNDATNPCVDTARGSLCYVVDNNTVGSSDVGGTLPAAGIIIGVPASGQPEYGKVLVAVGMPSLYVQNPELAANPTAFKARNVATNLAALTFTSGSFSADANGALGSQDGVTNAVGDIIMFPAGTITTGVVSAANSGPWVLTAVGGASAKFTGIRPDWWPHGGTITAGSAINIGGEGTLFGGTRWVTFAASTAVIGTTDPALYPEQVTQTVTLSSSAATITNVPIRSATKSNVVASLAAVGGTTTSTIGWGIIVAPTPGGIGTASTTVNAIASGGSKNGTADTSQLIVTIFN
jgi:hypothetical protein